MDNPEEFRRRLKEFTGAKIFTKFIKAFHRVSQRKNRLRLWQQDLLKSFTLDNPDLAFDDDELFNALRICELHEMTLVPVETPVFRGCIDYSPKYIEDMMNQFPHSSLSQVMVSHSYTNETHPIWVCAKCNEVRDASHWHRNA